MTGGEGVIQRRSNQQGNGILDVEGADPADQRFEQQISAQQAEPQCHSQCGSSFSCGFSDGKQNGQSDPEDTGVAQGGDENYDRIQYRMPQVGLDPVQDEKLKFHIASPSESMLSL